MDRRGFAGRARGPIALVFPALALALLPASCGTPADRQVVNRPAAENFAAAFGWRGYGDTDLPWADFWGDDHTLALRFMIQYPYAHTAPLVSDGGSGAFSVAKDAARAQLAVDVGGARQQFAGRQLAAGVWYHVTLVRQAGGFTVYLDGARLCPDLGPCSFPPGGNTPSGNLRLGRFGTGGTAQERDAQFYGFIDDVAVFRRALDAAEVNGLARQARLTGSEPGLFAGWTFDEATPDAGELPSLLRRGVAFLALTPGPVSPPRSFAAPVSQARDNAHDAPLLPAPFQQKAMQLPFPPGEAWQVMQGWENPTGSHNGFASFCWDFVLAGRPQAETLGRPIEAAAGGSVVEIRNDRDSCAGYPASYAMVEHAPSEIGAYLHFVKGSVRVTPGQTIAAGTSLAQAGDSGNAGCGSYHLHYALHTQPESQRGTLVTFPSAFSNYEMSSDGGATWARVGRGVPRNGQWVRNP